MLGAVGCLAPEILGYGNWYAGIMQSTFCLLGIERLADTLRTVQYCPLQQPDPAPRCPANRSPASPTLPSRRGAGMF